MKLADIEEQEVAKCNKGGRRILAVLPAAKQVWRTENNKKRIGVNSVSRWRNGTAKTTEIDLGFTSIPSIKKTNTTARPAKPAKSVERWSFAPRPVREIIKRNKTKIVERVRLVQSMKEEEENTE